MFILMLTNDGTGNNSIGHYNYEVFINTRKIAIGRVEGHDRSAGWKELIEKLAAVVDEAKSTEEIKPTEEELTRITKLIELFEKGL